MFSKHANISQPNIFLPGSAASNFTPSPILCDFHESHQQELLEKVILKEGVKRDFNRSGIT